MSLHFDKGQLTDSRFQNCCTNQNALSQVFFCNTFFSAKLCFPHPQKKEYRKKMRQVGSQKGVDNQGRRGPHGVFLFASETSLENLPDLQRGLLFSPPKFPLKTFWPTGEAPAAFLPLFCIAHTVGQNGCECWL